MQARTLPEALFDLCRPDGMLTRRGRLMQAVLELEDTLWRRLYRYDPTWSPSVRRATKIAVDQLEV